MSQYSPPYLDADGDTDGVPYGKLLWGRFVWNFENSFLGGDGGATTGTGLGTGLGRVDKVGQPFTDRGEVEEAGEG